MTEAEWDTSAWRAKLPAWVREDRPMTEPEWLVATTASDMLDFIREQASQRKLRLLACAWCRPLLERVETPGVSTAEMYVDAERYADGLISTSELLVRFPGLETPFPPAEMDVFYTFNALVQGTCVAVGALGWSPHEETNWQQEFVPGEEFPRVVAGSWLPGEYAVECTKRVVDRAAGAWALLESGYPYPGNPDDYGPWHVSAGVPERFFLIEKERHAHFASLIREILGNPFRPVTFSPEWRTDTAVAIARGMYESRDFSAMPILADALQDAGCDNTDVLDHCRSAGPHVRGCWLVDLLLVKS